MERLPSDFFPLFSHPKNNSFPPIFLLRWDGGNAGKDFGRETTTEVLETAKVGVFWILDFRFVALAASFFFWVERLENQLTSGFVSNGGININIYIYIYQYTYISIYIYIYININIYKLLM